MTRRLKHASTLVVLFGAGAILSGCTNFDPDNFGDMFDFNKKEKLAGERRPLFPEGVPGVTQGVPPHLVKGQQQQEAATIAAAPAPEPEKPKAAAKPKPRTASRPARVTVSPDQQPAARHNSSQPAAAKRRQCAMAVAGHAAAGGQFFAKLVTLAERAVLQHVPALVASRGHSLL